MKPFLFLGLCCAALPACSFAQAGGPRPPITGISHMSVYTADAQASEHFYVSILGAQKLPDPENPAGVRYSLSRSQWVEVLPMPAGQGPSRLVSIAWRTGNAAALRTFLLGRGQRDVSELKTGSDGSRYFETKDPEGNVVQFFEDAPGMGDEGAGAISHRIIHVGFAVHNRAAEDRFYKDLLGFKPYWYGAMKPDAVDWISQQVPDGTDWLEYMMVGDGSTTPVARLDNRELGVLNHFSLGVTNMEAAVTTLYKDDRLPPRHDGPQMGKDGKWQANLYDPDATRVELMEFQPVMEPCCSKFTAASPTR